MLIFALLLAFAKPVPELGFTGGGFGLAVMALSLGTLALAPGIAFFRSRPSPQNPHPEIPRLSFLFAGMGLLFGLVMVVTVVGCLLEAVSPERFGKFPDPEIAPWVCAIAVVTLGPSLAFFRSRLSSRPRPAVVRVLCFLFALLFGLPMVAVFVVGLYAALPLEVLPGVGTFASLLMTACALILALLVLGPSIVLLRSRLFPRDNPLAGNDSQPPE